MSFVAEHLDGFPHFCKLTYFTTASFHLFRVRLAYIDIQQMLVYLANKRSIDEGGNGLLGYTGYPKLRRQSQAAIACLETLQFFG